MPNPLPEKTKKEKWKERKGRGRRIWELEILLQEQKELTHRQTERALKYKAGCKKEKQAGAEQAKAMWIRNLQERFREFGYEKAEEVDSLADMARSTAAHQVMGEDVIVLPHCEAALREVMERGFKFLWGISANSWSEATPEQKSLTFCF
ncbi:unnamed protein product [Tuber aestivum]|uniref:Uncharacterized protein n=1 Tax=Tuber aestivum TaxID=59557 RepID=A0A292Q9X3_9PEZI|nr:unnamed protein product [Tuber aestivum]